jgi:hypothetical protein
VTQSLSSFVFRRSDVPPKDESRTSKVPSLFLNKKGTVMPQRLIGPSGGYRRLFSFGFTCLAYHATTRFCKRVYDFKTDPLGKTSGQMIGAARAARQNIAEGSARAGTSTETELRLYDVAKARRRLRSVSGGQRKAGLG